MDENNILFLTFDEVLEIHEDQLDNYGGSLGIRDEKMLKAALAQPESSFDGDFLHPDIYSMAAAYLYHLCQNHPFVDGNKRVATVSAIIFLEMNDYELDVSNELLEETVFKVASSKMSKDELVKFFERHSKPINF